MLDKTAKHVVFDTKTCGKSHTLAVWCSHKSSGQTPQRNEMTKEQMLEIIKLLSALESWSFSAGHRMPDYLFEKIDKAMDELTQEVLK